MNKKAENSDEIGNDGSRMVKEVGNRDSLPEIKCPDCGNVLSYDLLSNLLKGKDVFCEQCGFHFRGIGNDGNVLPLNHSEQKDLPEYDQKRTAASRTGADTIKKSSGKSNLREQQWIKWRSTWDKIKKMWALNMDELRKLIAPDNQPDVNNAGGVPYSSKVSSKVSYKQGGYYYPSKQSISRAKQDSISQIKPSGNVKSGPQPDYMAINSADSGDMLINPDPHQVRTPKMRKKFYEDHRRLRSIVNTAPFFVHYSELYYFIIILITFINFMIGAVQRTEIVFAVSQLMFQAVFVYTDKKYFLVYEKKGVIPNKGISAIMFGIMGLFANGIGIFMLIRGILYVSALSIIEKYEKPFDRYYIKCALEIGEKIGKRPKKTIFRILFNQKRIVDKKLYERIKEAYVNKEILVAFIPYSKELITVLFISVIVQNSFQIHGHMAYSIYFIIADVLLFIFYMERFVIQWNPYRIIGADSSLHTDGVILLILGILSIGNGFGVFGFVLALIILGYTDNIEKIRQSLPPDDELRAYISDKLLWLFKTIPNYRSPVIQQDAYTDSSTYLITEGVEDYPEYNNTVKPHIDSSKTAVVYDVRETTRDGSNYPPNVESVIIPMEDAGGDKGLTNESPKNDNKNRIYGKTYSKEGVMSGSEDSVAEKKSSGTDGSPANAGNNSPTAGKVPDAFQVEPSKRDDSDTTFGDMVFTVLDDSVRMKLLKLIELGVEKDIIDGILKACIYLSPEKRVQYLDMLLDQIDPNKEKLRYKTFNDRIDSLPLSDEEKMSIKAQLNYIPKDQWDAFVESIENSLVKDKRV